LNLAALQPALEALAGDRAGEVAAVAPERLLPMGVADHEVPHDQTLGPTVRWPELSANLAQLDPRREETLPHGGDYLAPAPGEREPRLERFS
jgi:hypothetical protein